MSPKSAIFIGMFIGSLVGGWVPSIFGADLFSYAGIVGSGLGALLGVYLGYKLTLD